MADQEFIDKLTIQVVTEKLNALIAECVGPDGSPKPPSAKMLAIARSYLPPQYSMAYPQKVKK